MLMTLFSLHTGLYLSLSLFLFLLNYKLLFPIMMTFCRKSVHFLLGLTATSMDAAAADHHHHHHHHHNLNPPWKFQALGLVTATNDIIRRRSPNVLESSSIMTKSTSSSSLPSNSPSPPPTSTKKDPGGIGFIDDIGGGVNGLMSCTESLGFESSDERRVDDDDEELSLVSDVRPWMKKAKWRTRMSTGSREVKKFPPPLSSLNRNGQPSFFLRSVRKDGRLELTEVRIYRPEILRAYRGDGRLRLHLIRDNDEDEDEDGGSTEEEDKQEQEQEHDSYIEQEKVEKSVLREEEEEGVERCINGDEWKISVSSAGEGFRRCHEVVNHHDHHHLHVWRHHCVTTR